MIKHKNSRYCNIEIKKDNFDKFMNGEDLFSNDNSVDDFDRSGNYSEGFSYDTWTAEINQDRALWLGIRSKTKKWGSPENIC